MKATTILMGIAICGAMAQSASADTWRPRVNNGDWNQSSTWQYTSSHPTGYTNAPKGGGSGPGFTYPGPNDEIYIDDFTVFVNITGAEVMRILQITNDGCLNVGKADTNGELILGRLAGIAGINDQTHTINGPLKLGYDVATDEATGKLVFKTVNHSVLGSSSIIGLLDGSEMQIQDNLPLYIETPVRGALKIAKLVVGSDDGAATLVAGTTAVDFEADRYGTLEIAVPVVEGNFGVTYRATAAVSSGATLLFSESPSTMLDGDFAITACGAHMVFNAAVSTTGTFTFTNGELVVNDLFCWDTETCEESEDLCD